MREDIIPQITYTIDTGNISKAIIAYDKKLKGCELTLIGIEQNEEMTGERGLRAYVLTFRVTLHEK